MSSNGPGKKLLLHTLVFAVALLLSPAVSTAQTDGTTLTATKPSSYDSSSAIEVGAGAGPTGIASDGLNVWVTNQFSNSVIKVAADGKVVGKYAVGKNPIGVATDGLNVWVANNGDDTMTKLSTDGALLGTFAVGNGPEAVLITGKYVWVTNEKDGSVTKLSVDGAVVGHVQGGPASRSAGHRWDKHLGG